MPSSRCLGDRRRDVLQEVLIDKCKKVLVWSLQVLIWESNASALKLDLGVLVRVMVGHTPGARSLPGGGALI